MLKKLLFLPIIIFAGSSCVSNKVFNSQRAENIRLEGELYSARTLNEELTGRNKKLSEQIESLCHDTTLLGDKTREMEFRYRRLLSEGSEESSRMLRQLQQNQSELEERARRVEELEQLLRQREEAIDAIRQKVADALLGFEGKGLTISTRDGKVYVSMEDKLLFKSGSFDIEPDGARAVRDLSQVLAVNPDINIMVEGHTDNVPYRPNGNLRDNLDLSVKRATTVMRLLLENTGIDPVRITAAGRGEFMPVSNIDSSEERAKNRRTEIILTPKLDELMRLMEN